jgi:hypothetical protein
MVPILKQMRRAKLQNTTGLSPRELRRVCNGRVMPMLEIRQRLLRVAAEHAWGSLGLTRQRMIWQYAPPYIIGAT